VGATTLAQILGVAIQIVSTVILARLLTPADFGLVTMVTTFSLLLMNAGGNGFTEAVLQRKEVNRLLVSNLFWINVGTGVVLTIAFGWAGSLMARFYHNPLVAPIALGLSLTILITSISVLHVALLMRAMRFHLVYANQMLARLISVGVSILLAWAGCGYWALVVGAVTQPLSECVGAWTLCRWVPGLPRREAETGQTVRFALNVYGRFTLNYFARNMDNLLVGRLFSASALGFYKKAYDLFALSTGVQSLTVVAVSALSRLRHDTEQYRRHLLSALSVSAFVGMGLGADLVLVGNDVVRLFLGPQWAPAGRIFIFFGPGIGAMFIYGTHSWIHLSIGRADRWFRWALVEFTVTGLLFVMGLRFGPVGIASAWSVSLWILTIPALWYAARPIGLRTTAMIGCVWKYVLASVIAAGATALAFAPLTSAPASSWIDAVVRIGRSSVVFALIYVGGVVVLHGSLKPVYELLTFVRLMIPWSGRGTPETGSSAPRDSEVASSSPW
jgi:PST family polysaccharide transporter